MVIAKHSIKITNENNAKIELSSSLINKFVRLLEHRIDNTKAYLNILNNNLSVFSVTQVEQDNLTNS